jgi:hypothetical protein
LHAEFWCEFAEHHFLPFANRSNWFVGKIRCIIGATVRHVIDWSAHASYLLIIDVDYEDGSEPYLLPLGFLPSTTNDLLEKAIVAEIARPDCGNFIINAIYDESFRRALFHNFTLRPSDTSLSLTRFEDIDDSYRSSNEECGCDGAFIIFMHHPHPHHQPSPSPTLKIDYQPTVFNG